MLKVLSKHLNTICTSSKHVQNRLVTRKFNKNETYYETADKTKNDLFLLVGTTRTPKPTSTR